MNNKEIKKIALRYGKVATALLGVHQAQAQVNYVDIADVTLNTNGATLELNIDNDTNGVVDYRIIQYVDTTDFNVSGSFIQARGTGRNQVVGLDYANYYYPFKLDLATQIKPDTAFGGLGTSRNWGQLGLSIADTTYPNDNFAGGVTDGFIGLRFRDFRNDTLRNFYGWLRVDVAADLKSITLKDYAWEEQYDSAIVAGAGSGLIGLQEAQAAQPQLQQLGQYLQVKLPDAFRNENFELSFTDLSGKEVSKISLSSDDTKVSLHHLPKGILVARVRVENAENSLKVVIY
jgi:hypothetical protein